VVVRRRRVIRGYGLGIELDHKLCHRGEWRSGAWDWALSDVQRVTKGSFLGRGGASGAEYCRAAPSRLCRRAQSCSQSSQTPTMPRFCGSVSQCLVSRCVSFIVPLLCVSVCVVCVCVCVLYKRLCAASTPLPFFISISRSRSRSLSHSLSLPPSILHPYPYHPPCVGDMTLFPRIFTILSLTDGIVYSMFHQDYANDCFSIFPFANIHVLIHLFVRPSVRKHLRLTRSTPLLN